MYEQYEGEYMNVFQRELNKVTKNKIKLYSTMWTNMGIKWSYRIVEKDTRWRHRRNLLKRKI